MTRRTQRRRRATLEDRAVASVLFIQRRLTALVGHLLADVGYLGAHFEHDPLDAAPDRKIAPGRAPRRQARQCGQGNTGKVVDQRIDIAPAHQFVLLLHQPQLQHLGLDRDVGRVGLRAR